MVQVRTTWPTFWRHVSPLLKPMAKVTAIFKVTVAITANSNTSSQLICLSLFHQPRYVRFGPKADTEKYLTTF